MARADYKHVNVLAKALGKAAIARSRWMRELRILDHGCQDDGNVSTAMVEGSVVYSASLGRQSTSYRPTCAMRPERARYEYNPPGDFKDSKVRACAGMTKLYLSFLCVSLSLPL